MKQKLFIFIFIPVLIASVFSGLIPSGEVSAAYRDLNTNDRAASYTYWRAVNHCVGKMATSIKADASNNGSSTKPTDGYWFGSGSSNGGGDPSHGNPVDVLVYKSVDSEGNNGGRRGCAEAIDTALKKYWSIDYVNFLKGIGYKWLKSSDGNYYWEFTGNTSREDALKQVLTRNGVNYDYTNSVQYTIYSKTFAAACGAVPVANPSKTIRDYADNETYADGYKYITIQDINGLEPEPTIYKYLSSGDFSGPSNLAILNKTLYQGNKKTCHEIATHLKKPSLAQAYIDELILDKCKQKGVDFSRLGDSRDSVANACIAGAKNADNDNYCATNYTSAADIAACDTGRGVEISDSDKPLNPNDATSGEEENPTSCDIQGTGWIICPIAETIASATDALYGWISNFLVVQPLNMDTASNENTTYIAWKNMRNVANIAFVIAFLIIIFSQLSGGGVSNYGVKKMLPRLIVAAILVNLSYWITAIAVDVSNIIGNNIYNVLRNMGIGSITFEANMWESLMVWLLSLGAIGGGTIAAFSVIAAGTGGAVLSALLWGALVALLAAFLSLLIAFAILALRQALIIILIILSPLAFVAFLLPNTEKFFNLWRKSLTTLLIFYPLFSVLFGGAYIASLAIIGSAGQATGSGQGGDPAAVGMMVLLGLTVQAIPLALTPMLIKFSSGIMGTVAGMVNNKSRGLIDRARNVRNRKSGLAMHETLGHRKNARNPFGRIYRRSQNSARVDSMRKDMIESTNQEQFATALKDSPELQASAGRGHEHGSTRALAAANSAVKSITEDAIKNVKLSADFKPGAIDDVAQAFKKAVKDGDSVKARAYQDILQSSGGPGIQKWRDTITSMESDPSSGIGNGSMSNTLRSRTMESNPGIKSSDAAAAKWATSQDNLASIRSNPSTWSGLSNDELMSQKSSFDSQAGQITSALGDALRQGAITGERAFAMQASESFNKMSKEAMAEISKIASTYTPPSGTP